MLFSAGPILAPSIASKTMKIGLISDTHGQLPKAVLGHFKDVGMIIHAGDIGSADVIDDLSAAAEVHAINGNSDSWELAHKYPPRKLITANGYNILIEHIVNDPFKHYLTLKRDDSLPFIDFVIFGHTHQPFVHHYGGKDYINPGSIYKPRHNKGPSVAILQLDAERSKCQTNFYYLSQ
jgi:putative phosphoesterase